ncbi:MAG TPA: lytic transglycosylase domain-containing protein, partial [Chloroflexia bacterium]|nr:lytic transglycosylase domain-containing protein [Chloroflexia bacterium]
DAAWWTARSFEALDNWEQTASWYKGFTEVYTNDIRLPEGLLHHGNALEKSDDIAGALAIYDQLITTYPTSQVAAAALDHEGVILRRQEDWAGAAARWQADAESIGADAEGRARARFWQGWSLRKQGDAAAATAAWRAGAAYRTFWGARCADQLAGRAVPSGAGPTAAAQVRLKALAVPDTSRQAETDLALLRWAAGWSITHTEVSTITTVPPQLSADPAYRRALALGHAALWSDASTAFADLTTTLEQAGDGTSLATLALDARRAGWPWLAYPVARGLQRAARAAHEPADVPDLPRGAQELLFPAPWPALVGAQAAEQDVDPWLLLALMRQESAYYPQAHSSADARGLTQVIPGTAEGIAAALKVPDFQQSALYRPAVSIRFGAFYLAETLGSLDRNILYSLAAYNAGQGPIPGWTGGRVGDDPDLFADNIDYPETRQYVSIVYNNYAIYRWLYGTP